MSSLPGAEQGASFLACAPPATRALLLLSPPGSGWGCHHLEHFSLLSVLSNLCASKRSTEASSPTFIGLSYVLLVFLSLTRVIPPHPGDLFPALSILNLPRLHPARWDVLSCLSHQPPTCPSPASCLHIYCILSSSLSYFIFI